MISRNVRPAGAALGQALDESGAGRAHECRTGVALCTTRDTPFT
jgi:hypothetical protein